MTTLRLLADLLCIVPRLALAWLKTKLPHLRITKFAYTSVEWGCFVGWVGPNPATDDKRVFQIGIDIGPIHIGWSKRIGFYLEAWRWTLDTEPPRPHCTNCGWGLPWDTASLLCSACQIARRRTT